MKKNEFSSLKSLKPHQMLKKSRNLQNRYIYNSINNQSIDTLVNNRSVEVSMAKMRSAA